MLNEDCRIQSNQHNTLIVRKLQNHAKNRVIAANVCVVEKKRVDLAIDCYRFSERMEAKGNMEMRWELGCPVCRTKNALD